MGEVAVTGSARLGFSDISQHGELKPTAVFRLLSGALDHWWEKATGLPGPDFLEETGLRNAMVQLDIAVAPVTVHDEQEVVLDFSCTLGAMPGREGRPPRFGGRDLLAVRPAGDPTADPVAVWTAWWVWFRPGEDGRLRLVNEPAELLRTDQDDIIGDAEPTPEPVEPRPSSAFRWTARETDMNDHVFFLSYLERAQNTLADLGLEEASLRRWHVWFQRPAFLGEYMVPRVGQAPGGEPLVALHNQARDETSAIVRASP